MFLSVLQNLSNRMYDKTIDDTNVIETADYATNVYFSLFFFLSSSLDKKQMNKKGN